MASSDPVSSAKESAAQMAKYTEANKIMSEASMQNSHATSLQTQKSTVAVKADQQTTELVQGQAGAAQKQASKVFQG
jgi:hypothetical protein